MYSNKILMLNRTKVFFYMALITGIIGFAGYVVSEMLGYGLMGFGVFLIFAGILDFVAYFFSDTLVIKSTGAVPIREEDMPQYYSMVRDMCSRNEIKMPRLYMINTDAMNAFATGRNQDNAVVAVTRGLIKKLSLEEVSGVVGHELSHIANGDMLLMSVISVLVGFLSIFSHMFWYSNSMSKIKEKDESGITVIISIAVALLAPLVATFIKFAISRSREYMADAKGAQICAHPQYLASALEKIKNDGVVMPNINEATAHLYFSNPLKGNFFTNLFSTHPNIDDRIRKLEYMENDEKPF